MSKRKSDRIKIVIDWIELHNDLQSRQAGDTVRTRIIDTLPGKYDTYMSEPMRTEITTTEVTGGVHHQHVYRFKYKRRWRNSRQTELHSVMFFAMAMLVTKNKIAEDLTLNINMYGWDRRTPWVFQNGDHETTPTMIAHRPGAIELNVCGSKVVTLPSLNAEYMKLLGLSESQRNIVATDFKIIGEPRAVYKAARRCHRALEQGHWPTVDSTREKTDDDLICMLYRNRETDSEWHLVTDGNYRLMGQYLKNAITGIPVEGAKFWPDLKMRYVIKEIVKGL